MSSQECRLLHDGIVMASMSMCIPEREKGAEGHLVVFQKLRSFNEMKRLPREKLSLTEEMSLAR